MARRRLNKEASRQLELFEPKHGPDDEFDADGYPIRTGPLAAREVCLVWAKRSLRLVGYRWHLSRRLQCVACHEKQVARIPSEGFAVPFYYVKGRRRVCATCLFAFEGDPTPNEMEHQ